MAGNKLDLVTPFEFFIVRIPISIEKKALDNTES